MKKFLLLICVLLTGVSGAWADVLPASTWNISQALPTDNWVAMGENTPTGVTSLGSYTAYYRTQEVTLTTAGMISIKFLYSSGDHMLEILGVDALNGSSEVVASDYHYGYTGGNRNLNDYFLNGLSAGTYTLRYIIHNGNTTSSVGNITLRKYEADVVASLPQLTTDVNNPKYYSIGSYDRGGYLTSNGAGQGMTHVAFAVGSSWYFTAINGNNSGSVIGGVIAYCSDGTQMKQNWQTAASGQTVYILPNGVNTNGFSISKTFPISTWSCCDANNKNTGVGDWQPASNDWKGTTWVIEPTIPINYTGYYYFKGMATDRHPYLFSDFVGKSTTATYHHDLPGSPSNGHIWKVTNNGTTFNATNGEGLPVTINSTTYETLNLSAASAGPDYYFTEAINLTNWGTENGNEQQLTTWAGHPDATDNKWTFELADVSAGVYNVVVQGNDDGYVTYSGQNAKNGGFFVAASIAVGDLTAHPIDGYTTSISISDRTITVSYNQQISYTLTDANGATYSWSASGPFGVAPTLTGCAGYSLSNEEWNEGSHSYSATINFPFAVSTPTFIGQFHNKNLYNSKDFLWHANGTSVVVHSGDLPDETSDEQNKYLWVIEPVIDGLNITFKIKNVYTGTYIHSESTDNSHNQGAVTLGIATPLEYQTSSTTNCGTIYTWYIPSTGKYLSVNSTSGPAGSLLGVWSLAANHDGPSTGFHTYADLIDSYWTNNGIAGKIAKAGQCGYPATNESNYSYLAYVKGALERGIYEGTAENFSNLVTWYKGFLAADVVLPTAGFYRIKSSAQGPNPNLYLMGVNSTSNSTRAALYASSSDNYTEKGATWYFNGSYLYNYSNGWPAVKDGSNMLGVATDVNGAATSIVFQKASTVELGSLNVKFASNRYLYANNGYTDAAGGAPNAGYNWVVEDVTTLPVTISDAGYATLWSPVALSIPNNVTAYTATDNGQSLTLNPIDGIIPAETGVILKGAQGSYDFTITTTEATASSVLTGQAATIAKPSGAYYLGKGESGVGFYPAAASSIATMAGFKAYLPAGSTSKAFMGFQFDDTDAINSITNELNSNEIYNLAGQRLNKLQRGVNIVNGKKVLVK